MTKNLLLVLSALVMLILSYLYFFKKFDKKSKEIIYTKEAPKPIGPYSQGVTFGGTLFVSGQIALNPTTGVFDSTSIEKETHQVLKNLEAVVKAAGLELNNVTKVTIYLTDLKNFEAVNKVYSRFFVKDFPARECIQVSALPKHAHVEMSAFAKN